MRFAIEVNTSAKKDSSITLKDNLTNCEAEIYSFGALLNAFSVKVDDKKINIVDGFIDIDEAKANATNGFKSSKLAPFVCRMNKGEYQFNNQSYKIDKFYLGEHAIHGIIYDAVFEIVNTHADEHFASVGLRYKYEATDKGYPFSFEILVNWKLEAGNKLSVKTTMVHFNKQAIPVADGWHPYFKLGESIDDCSIQFDSNTQLEFDATLIPTGKKINDERFINATLLKNIFLDNCFELKNPGTSTCTLQNNTLKLIILPDKAYPYLQIYTPPHRKSIAIENLSAAPDCFNNKIGLVLLEPGHHINFTTSYVLHVL